MHSRIKMLKISKSTEISSCLLARPRYSCLSRRLNEGRREDERVAKEQGRRWSTVEGGSKVPRTTYAFQYFRVSATDATAAALPTRILHLEYSTAIMQVTIGACRCLPRLEIPVMEWIERLSLSSRFRFPFIPRFARGTLRAAAEPYRKIARHLLDKDQQPCSLTFPLCVTML